MQSSTDTIFLYLFPIYFVALWAFVGYIVGLVGGWRLLAKRFRTRESFHGQRWMMQSARMRLLAGYNSVLTVGADSSGLYLATFILFRAGHPPLLVPWSEIAIGRTTRFFFTTMVELRLGRSEDVPFTISTRLADRLEAAAGPSWPGARQAGTIAPPPPIG